MPDLAAEITEYLVGERQPMTRADLIGWIIMDANRCKTWTIATCEQWEAAIDEAIKRGLIESRNGKLGVVLKIDNEPKPQQMGLFDDVL